MQPRFITIFTDKKKKSDLTHKRSSPKKKKSDLTHRRTSFESWSLAVFFRAAETQHVVALREHSMSAAIPDLVTLFSFRTILSNIFCLLRTIFHILERHLLYTSRSHSPLSWWCNSLNCGMKMNSYIFTLVYLPSLRVWQWTNEAWQMTVNPLASPEFIRQY